MFSRAHPETQLSRSTHCFLCSSALAVELECLDVSVHIPLTKTRQRISGLSISRHHVHIRLSAEIVMESDQSKVSHAACKRQSSQSTRYTVAPLSLAWFGVFREKTVTSVYILKYFLLSADASTCLYAFRSGRHSKALLASSACRPHHRTLPSPSLPDRRV